MTFIDLTKAFDTVHRSTLWKILQKIGYPKKLIDIVGNIHDKMTAYMLVSGGEFGVKTGVMQGYSWLLFSI